MARQFRTPSIIGEKLEGFAQGGLTNVLSEAICGKGNKLRHQCDGECIKGKNCPGFVALCHLENQIGEAGIEFMKDLVKTWAKPTKER